MSDLHVHNDPVASTGAGRRDWIGLVVLAFAVLIVAVDGTVLDLALPFISSDLQPTGNQLLWIIDVYSFVLAGLLITMGTLGDRIGRRRLLLLGAAGFGVASVLAAFSTSPEMLIAARVLQGFSGATLMPATLGLIRTMFTVPRQRVMAIGVWGAMAGGGAAVGPLVGGWLLEHFWWGSVFLINIPVMAALVCVGPKVIPESKDPEPGKFDLISAGLSMLALVPLVYAIKETAAHGLSVTTVTAAVVGLVAGSVFVHRQKHLDDPMMDLGLFGNRAFSTAVLTNFLAVFSLAGVLFFGAQYLQLVLGNSPLEAGLLLLPGTASTIVFSLAAGYLLRFFSAGSLLGVGLAAAAAGACMLLGLGVNTGPALFIGGFVLIGAGAGVALTLASDLVVGAVAPGRAGAASAISETAYELGIALGVALLGTVVMASFRGGLDLTGLDPGSASSAQQTLGGAIATARDLPDEAAAALVDSAQTAFVTGMHIASAVTALVLAATAVAVAIRMRVQASSSGVRDERGVGA